MKRLIGLLIILSVIGGTFFFFRQPVQAFVDRWITVSFCEDTKLFRIGTVDSEFDIDYVEVYRNALQAAEIWNEAYPTNLVEFDINAPLTVNLVYDERQNTITKIDEISTQVDETRQDLTSQLEDFERQKQDLENRITTLNEKIEYWNQRGGAPVDEYNKLAREQQTLQEESTRFQVYAEQINANISGLNTKIDGLNRNVEAFNSILTVKPEGGIYDPFNKKIDIYFYNGEEDFVSILAHELGHYIGLGHALSPESIMYPINTSGTKLTEEDLQMLNTFCEDRNRIELIKNDARNLVNNYLMSRM